MILRFLPAFYFWLLSSLLHLKFSLFLVKPIETYWGVIKLKNYAPELGYLLIFSLVLFLCWYFYSKRPRSTLLLWIIWSVGVFLINCYLLATPLENIHFVQYALIALLFIWALKPKINNPSVLIAKTIFWVSLAGIIDELMQYLWITASYSNHLDFNDFLLNLMGTIAGVLLYISFYTLDISKTSYSKVFYSVEAIILILLSSFLILLFYFDSIQLATLKPIKAGGFGLIDSHSSFFFERSPNLLGSWSNAFNGGKYYILSSLQGTLIFVLIALGFYGGVVAALKK